MTSKCPTCGESRSATSHGSNSGLEETVTIPAHLLPAISDALKVATARALMCSAPEAMEALQSAREMLDERKPEIVDLFGQYVWFAICERAAAGRRLEVRLADDGRYFSPRYWIEITDGEGQIWPNYSRSPVLKSDDFSDEADAQAALRALRDEIARRAPMTE